MEGFLTQSALKAIPTILEEAIGEPRYVVSLVK